MWKRVILIEDKSRSGQEPLSPLGCLPSNRALADSKGSRTVSRKRGISRSVSSSVIQKLQTLLREIKGLWGALQEVKRSVKADRILMWDFLQSTVQAATLAAVNCLPMSLKVQHKPLKFQLQTVRQLVNQRTIYQTPQKLTAKPVLNKVEKESCGGMSQLQKEMSDLKKELYGFSSWRRSMQSLDGLKL